MQKKEGITPVSGASEKFLRSHLLECWKTPFLNVEQTLSLLSTGRKAVARQSFLRSEHALLIQWLSQARQVLSQKSREVFYFLSVRATESMEGNMDSKPQQKVWGINLASVLKQISQNCEISQTSSSFLAVEDDTVALQRFQGEGEEHDDSVVVSDAEEVHSCSADTGATREFNTEVFIESVRELPCLWNTSLVSYRDRNIKANAWKQLSSLFNRDGEYQLGLDFTSFALYLAGLRNGFCMHLFL